MPKIRLILAFIIVSSGLVSTAGRASATLCITINGGTYTAMGNAGPGCQKHHIISTQSLEATKNLPSPGYPTGHKVTKWRGPTVRMDKDIHKDTPNWGHDGQDDRDLEQAEILALGIVEAFERAAKRYR